MPRLNDIISEKSRKNLMEIKGRVKSNYIGETPNLNSSLGVNAADGTLPWMTDLDPNAKEELVVPKEEESKFSQFWTKNQNLLLGIGGALLGGSGQDTSQQQNNFPPQDDKKKNTWIWWVIGAIILIVIIILVIRAKKK